VVTCVFFKSVALLPRNITNFGGLQAHYSWLH
jgi:hypothetical protein